MQRSMPGQTKFVSKLFWPLQCPTERSGLVLGWNVRNFVACVATIVPDIELEVLEDALSVMARDPDLEDLWAHTSGTPIVLGEWIAEGAAPKTNDVLEACRRTANFWVTLQSSGGSKSLHPALSSTDLPVLKSVYCCGFLYRTSSQMVLYQRPKAASFLSDQPFSFDWSKFWSSSAKPSAHVKPTDLQFVLRQINSSAKLNSVLEKVLRSSNPPCVVSQALSQEAESESPDWKARENTVYRRKPLPLTAPADEQTPRRRQLSQSASLVWRRAAPKEDSSFCSRRSFPRAVVRSFVHIVHALLLALRALLAIISHIINHPVPLLFGGGRVKDRSALFQQLDRRIVQLSRWPFMWLRTHKSWQNDAFSNASFMCFWSSLCQCAVDVLSGLLVGILLRNFSSVWLFHLHEAGQLLHVDVLRRQVIWLMDLPAGLKLNVNLDHTLGSMVLYGIDFWNSITTVLTPLEPLIIRIVSFVGIFGMSMVIACSADMLSFLTIHVNFVHTAFSRLYALAMAALSALWKLFRGKKNNVLKCRIDSCHYDVDQLLMGTILFTLIFFLFPTVAIYYFFFSIVRFLITLVEAALWFLICFYNHFPFFSVGVFALDRGRLPGGLQIEIAKMNLAESSVSSEEEIAGSGVQARPSDTYILLHNCDVSFSALFYEFSTGIRNLCKHFSLVAHLKSMLIGRRFPASTPSIEEEASMDYTPGLTDFWFYLKAYATP